MQSLQLYILTTTTDAPELPTDVPSPPLDLHRLLVAAGLLQGPRYVREAMRAYHMGGQGTGLLI